MRRSSDDAVLPGAGGPAVVNSRTRALLGEPATLTDAQAAQYVTGYGLRVLVMAGLGPAIHVFAAHSKKRRG